MNSKIVKVKEKKENKKNEKIFTYIRRNAKRKKVDEAKIKRSNFVWPSCLFPHETCSLHFPGVNWSLFYIFFFSR